MNPPNPTILVFGGAFDPVHDGHVAIAKLACTLTGATELHLVPTGMARLKPASRTAPQHRVAMLRLAFGHDCGNAKVVIDQQEILRASTGIPSFSVETLENLRRDVGATAGLIMLIGADQLLQLHTWKRWDDLIGLAHILVMTRPDASLSGADSQVAALFRARSAGLAQFQDHPSGYCHICMTPEIGVSSTSIREQLGRHESPGAVPEPVIDYIQHHHLYQN